MSLLLTLVRAPRPQSVRQMRLDEGELVIGAAPRPTGASTTPTSTSPAPTAPYRAAAAPLP